MGKYLNEKMFVGSILFTTLWLVYPDRILFILKWKDARGVELLLSFLTALGVFIAYYQFSKSQRRQEEIDQSSVSVNIKNDQSAREGVFSIVNYGEIAHKISIEKAILNSGHVGDTGFEDKNPKYNIVFQGIIKPKQSIDMHFFDVVAEEIFLFKGAIKVCIDNQESVTTITKVRYAGGCSNKIIDSFPHLHPLFKWVIYGQL